MDSNIIYKKSLKILIELFLEIDNKEDLENLFKGLLTSNEVEEFARRIEIVRLIKQKVPHHEIAKKLGIGVATVTRGSKEVKLGRFRVINS
jgi:TrpR family transcriptional regulator, trp operon repressor